MMLPDEIALDFAIAKAGLILISSLGIVVYLARLATKLTFGKSDVMRVQRAHKPVTFGSK